MSRDSRTTFSKSEFAQIEALVRSLEKADADKQKGIRGKIRKIGLYWSEVASGMPYTVDNLRRLVSIGTIIVDGSPVSTSKSTSAKASQNVDPLFASLLAVTGNTNPNAKHGRANSDEYYVISLCNEALGMTAEQQYRFPFLLGDSGTPLPVDAYYQKLNLVVEYYERQHTERVKFFDRRETVSGVSRGEQRKIYDERRRVELPKHGIKLVILQYSDFGDSKKLKRDHAADLVTVKRIFKANKINVK